MTRYLPLFLLLTAILFAGGCGGTNFAIEYDYDVKADFSDLKTYAWLEEQGSETGNDEADAIVREALESLLAKKGMRPVQSGEPDVLVGVTYEMERKIQTRQIDSQYGYDQYDEFRYRFDTRPETAIIDYVEGTLIVDIASSDGKRPIWRGWAVGAIRDNMTIDQIRAEATEALRQVLEKFPPPATRRK